MKYYKRKNEYKASNVRFEVDGKKGWSYDWWLFSVEIDGKLLFNNTTYSVSTTGHQSKVRSQIGYDTPIYYMFYHTQISLECLESAFKGELKGIKNEIKDLVALINKKGTRKVKNEKRKATIEFYLKQIDIVIAKAKGLGYNLEEYRSTGLKYNKNPLSQVLYKDKVIVTDLLGV